MSDEQKGLTSRESDYSQWYLDVIAAADMADYSPVKGCMVIKPWGYAIWENIQKILNEKFKAKGVKNAYFPLLIPQSFLTKEAEHVEGFAPECAVVTEAGGKKLEEPLVVRPTSETIMYDMYSKWIKSYRDLPLLINQWANVVRWEMRTRLFLRTTEFLWQEGHTVHATAEEADAFSREMLEVYRDFAENYMAMSVVSGVKSDAERFAGAVRTYSIEAMMQDGKALQAGTSHFLGDNFAKAFNVKFLNENNEEKFAWQTSWGVSTRLIGALIMAHSDDKGLVLPPKLAPLQVVIVPIGIEKNPDLAKAVEKLGEALKNQGISFEVDKRENLRPGAKFFEWEKKGVPVRIEIGPKDLEKNQFIAARRDTGEKASIDLNDDPAKNIVDMLDDIQDNLLEKSKKFREQKTYGIDSYDDFQKLIESQPGFYSAHWCGSAECEQKIKEETKATVRCTPFGAKDESGKCLYCGKNATIKVIFARSY
ncbi:MAG: proline--tRNA ligase [Patescibacteria group bacterium]